MPCAASSTSEGLDELRSYVADRLLHVAARRRHSKETSVGDCSSSDKPPPPLAHPASAASVMRGATAVESLLASGTSIASCRAAARGAAIDTTLDILADLETTSPASTTLVTQAWETAGALGDSLEKPLRGLTWGASPSEPLARQACADAFFIHFFTAGRGGGATTTTTSAATRLPDILASLEEHLDNARRRECSGGGGVTAGKGSPEDPSPPPSTPSCNADPFRQGEVGRTLHSAVSAIRRYPSSSSAAAEKAGGSTAALLQALPSCEAIAEALASDYAGVVAAAADATAGGDVVECLKVLSYYAVVPFAARTTPAPASRGGASSSDAVSVTFELTKLGVVCEQALRDGAGEAFRAAGAEGVARSKALLAACRGMLAGCDGAAEALRRVDISAAACRVMHFLRMVSAEGRAFNAPPTPTPTHPRADTAPAAWIASLLEVRRAAAAQAFFSLAPLEPLLALEAQHSPAEAAAVRSTLAEEKPDVLLGYGSIQRALAVSFAGCFAGGRCHAPAAAVLAFVAHLDTPGAAQFVRGVAGEAVVRAAAAAVADSLQGGTSTLAALSRLAARLVGFWEAAEAAIPLGSRPQAAAWQGAAAVCEARLAEAMRSVVRASEGRLVDEALRSADYYIKQLSLCKLREEEECSSEASAPAPSDGSLPPYEARSGLLPLHAFAGRLSGVLCYAGGAAVSRFATRLANDAMRRLLQGKSHGEVEVRFLRALLREGGGSATALLGDAVGVLSDLRVLLRPAFAMAEDMAAASGVRQLFAAMLAELAALPGEGGGEAAPLQFAPLPLSSAAWAPLEAHACRGLEGQPAPSPLSILHFPEPFRSELCRHALLFERLFSRSDTAEGGGEAGDGGDAGETPSASEAVIRSYALRELGQAGGCEGPRGGAAGSGRIRRHIAWAAGFGRVTLADTLTGVHIHIPPAQAVVLLAFSAAAPEALLGIPDIQKSTNGLDAKVIQAALQFLTACQPYPLLVAGGGDAGSVRYSLSPLLASLPRLSAYTPMLDSHAGGASGEPAFPAAPAAVPRTQEGDVLAEVLRACRTGPVPVSHIAEVCAGLVGATRAPEVTNHALKFLRKRGFLERVVGDEGDFLYRRPE